MKILKLQWQDPLKFKNFGDIINKYYIRAAHVRFKVLLCRFANRQEQKKIIDTLVFNKKIFDTSICKTSFSLKFSTVASASHFKILRGPQSRTTLCPAGIELGALGRKSPFVATGYLFLVYYLIVLPTSRLLVLL